MKDFDFDFNSLFKKSLGKPILYKGQELILADKIPVNYDEKLRITIESTNSKYIQGVGISDNIEIFGQKVGKAVVWEYYSVPPENRENTRNQLPYSFEVICKNKKGEIFIYNMAEVDGRQDYWNFGCAMIVENIENGKRYKCNDWQPNEDFNDIIFRVEKVGI